MQRREYVPLLVPPHFAFKDLLTCLCLIIAVAVVIFSQTGKLHEFSSNGDIDHTLLRYSEVCYSGVLIYITWFLMILGWLSRSAKAEPTNQRALLTSVESKVKLGSTQETTAREAQTPESASAEMMTMMRMKSTMNSLAPTLSLPPMPLNLAPAVRERLPPDSDLTLKVLM